MDLWSGRLQAGEIEEPPTTDHNRPVWKRGLDRII
jgi:hypothetical protein